MDSEREPLDALKKWQEWYRSHHGESIVTIYNTPTTPEDPKAMWMQKAKEHFADTLAEYQYELSGKDLYKAFYAAAQEQLEHVKKEYDRAKQLVDCLKGLN